MTRRGTRLARPFPGDPADAHGLHRACVDYLDHIEVRNYSPRTVVGFGASLAVFVTWCAERGVARPAEVTRPVLERYQRHLFHRRKPDGTPLSNRTQYGRLVPVRGLFRFLVRHNRILSNPASDLEMPRVEHRLPRHVLSASEAETVVAQPKLSLGFGVRDRAILEVLYFHRHAPPGADRAVRLGPRRRARHGRHPPGQGAAGPHGPHRRAGRGLG